MRWPCWLILAGCASEPAPATPDPGAAPGGGDSGAATTAPPDTAPPVWDTGGAPAPCTAGLQVHLGDAAVGEHLDLGVAPAYGSAAALTLTLSNPCDHTIGLLGHPGDWLDDAAFRVVDLPGVRLEPGARAALSLGFSPGESGEYTGTLTLPYDQPGSPFVVSLAGTAAAPLPLVLVGEGRRVSTTLDYGETWALDTWETLDAHTDVMQRGGCFGAGTFVSVGGSAEGRWWTSADGVTWEAHRDAGLGAIAGCAHDGTRFVAAAGAPLASADGRTWTAGSAAHDPDHLRAMTWADGAFIAVGDNGRVARTADGAAWTTDLHAGTASFRAVAAGGGVVVAVGEGGSVATSTDAGASWSTQVVGDGHPWSGVVHGQDGFLIGGGGELYASPDGVTWRIVNASSVVPMATTGPFVFGVVGEAVHRSGDGGFTWTELKPAAGGPGFADAVLGGGAG